MAAHLRLELAKVVNASPEESSDQRASLGYVKVQFADELRSDWLPLVSPFAGKDYGMFALPEEGTPALVAFATEDRTCGYVVGFLWSGVSSPPVSGLEAQRQVWTLKTKGGREITIDDKVEGAAIEIKDREGNCLKFDTVNKQISLHGVGSLSIEATESLSIKAAGSISIGGSSITLTGDVTAGLIEATELTSEVVNAGEANAAVVTAGQLVTG